MSRTLADYRAREPKEKLARTLTIWTWVVSLLVLGLVTVMGRVTIPVSPTLLSCFSLLPMVNALLNTGTAVALVLALVMIKMGKPLRHQQCMESAFRLSAIFLVSYVVYHFTAGETKFGDLNGDGTLSEAEKSEAGGIRYAYYALLISHIGTAAVGLPFILLAFVYAVTNQFAKHRRIVRWVYPLWLYIAVTGPAVYLMLRPYY